MTNNVSDNARYGTKDDEYLECTIGEWHGQSTQLRKTAVVVDGVKYIVKENYWGNDDKWGVGLHPLDSLENCHTKDDVIHMMKTSVTKMKVLSFLDYEMDDIVDGVMIWYKSDG